MTKIFFKFITLFISGIIIAPSLALSAQAIPTNNSNPVCLLKTSKGDIYLELFAQDAPKTVKNFVDLAEGKKTFTDPKTHQQVKRPFYDNLIFHRVIKGFMIQGGCPLGDGTGGPGYTFGDEINADSLGLDKIKVVQKDRLGMQMTMIRSKQDFQRIVLQPLFKKMGITTQAQIDAKNKEIFQKINSLSVKECYENLGYQYNNTLKSHKPLRGGIAMANSGPDTNGSQFFINLVDTPHLTGRHTVFGKVIKGMEVVDAIGEVPVSAGNKPIEDVKIISIRLQQPNQKQTP